MVMSLFTLHTGVFKIADCQSQTGLKILILTPEEKLWKA